MSYLDDNRNAIAAEWKRLGWSDNMIYGMLGRAQRESSFNTGIANPNDAGPGLHSKGLFQWNRERLGGLFNFAKKQGMKWTDPRLQALYTHYEITGKTDAMKDGDVATGPEKATWRRLTAAQDLQGAVDAAMLYTRPYGSVKGRKLTPRSGLHYRETLQAAKKFAGIPIDPVDSMQMMGNRADDPKYDNNVFAGRDSGVNDAAAQLISDTTPKTDSQGTRLPDDSPDLSNLIGNFMSSKNTKPAPPANPSIGELANLFSPKLSWASL